MTIKVVIRNDDATRSLIVETIERERDTDQNRKTMTQDIQPGNSAIFHVYLLRDLLVREKLP